LSGSNHTGRFTTIDEDVLREIFANKLIENLRRDLAQKTTTIGPHRDDLAVFFGDKDVRSFGSQGQQRIASISLKLCELYILKNRLKKDPVLLLDDVLSELDIDRWKKLVDVINNKSQTFVTSTNSSYFDRLDIDFKKKYLIENNEASIMQ